MANLATPNGLPFTVTRRLMAPKSMGSLYLYALAIQFPDGMRSAVALGRVTMPPKGDPGWHANLTVADSQGGQVAGTPTAAHFDSRMNAGDVLFWFMHPGDKNWARGLWSRDAARCNQNEQNAFAWGMQQLASQVAVSVGLPPTNQAPTSTNQNVPQAMPGPMPGSGSNVVAVHPQTGAVIVAPPPPAPRRWPLVVGGLLAAGLVAYAIVD
jgi:hypothetical protein